jgi:alpha-amylase
MCTKYFSDGDVHRYFNPYESPYDSYINFMNVLDNMRTRVEAVEAPGPEAQA